MRAVVQMNSDYKTHDYAARDYYPTLAHSHHDESSCAYMYCMGKSPVRV